MINVACVLRSGGDYDTLDVERLANGVWANLHEPYRFLCFTDLPPQVLPIGVIPVPLLCDWPGWWAKLNLYGPSFEGDLFYLDLDSIIVGDLKDLATFGRLGIMRDVYRPDGLQSSVMFIPQGAKAEIWDAFTADPDRHMAECSHGGKWGDQGFLEGFWLDKAARFQDHLPGQIASYKADVRQSGVHPDNRLIVFHGKPRPRDIGWQL